MRQFVQFSSGSDISLEVLNSVVALLLHAYSWTYFILFQGFFWFLVISPVFASFVAQSSSSENCSEPSTLVLGGVQKPLCNLQNCFYNSCVPAIPVWLSTVWRVCSINLGSQVCCFIFLCAISTHKTTAVLTACKPNYLQPKPSCWAQFMNSNHACHPWE